MSLIYDTIVRDIELVQIIDSDTCRSIPHSIRFNGRDTHVAENIEQLQKLHHGDHIILNGEQYILGCVSICYNE